MGMSVCALRSEGFMNAGPGIADARRRALVEDALRCPDIPRLTNAEISRLLSVGIWEVRRGRRRLEVRGEIDAVYQRLNRHGSIMDVSRIGGRNRKYEAACGD